MTRQLKWDRRWLHQARFIASFSKDPSSQVGAAIIRPDQTLASIGYNGFPRNMVDHPEWLDDRSKKYPRTIHAELNARDVCPERPIGYTIYIWPVFCCAPCASLIAQSGITRVVAPLCLPEWLPRWGTSLAEAKEILEDCHVAWLEMPFRTDPWSDE